MESSKYDALVSELQPFAKAANPIAPELLAVIPYFTTVFPDKRLHALLCMLAGQDGTAYLEKKHFKPGQKLIGKGQIDQMIYWVLEGQVNVVTEINGQPKVIHTSGKGECFGALGVLRGGDQKRRCGGRGKRGDGAGARLVAHRPQPGTGQEPLPPHRPQPGRQPG